MNPIKTCAVFVVAATALCSCGGGGGGQGGARGPTPVVVASAFEKDLSETVFAVGSVVADEVVEIQSEVAGVVEEVAFSEGERVAKGATLFRIDEETLQAEVAEAQANFKLAQANLRRSKELLDSRTISSKEYDQSLSEFQSTKATLERAKKGLTEAVLSAPFDGVTGARLVSPGQLVSVGQTLTSLVHLETVKAEFNVAERYLSALKLGAEVQVSVDAFPGENFVGTIFFISPRIDAATRTVLVKARIKNEDLKLRDGMLAAVNVTTRTKQGALVIPESAVMQRKDGKMVFAVGEGDAAELKQVKTGIRLKGEVEVVEGLQVGTLVVVEGLQKIGPGSPLKFTQSEQS